MTEIVKYLELTKNILSTISKAKTIRTIIGNNACDLDSAVSTISLGYYLHKTSALENNNTIPILNIPKNDFVLKTEVTYVFKKLGIHSSLLTFLDEIDLKYLHENKKLDVVLVDRNFLFGDEEYLINNVSYIVDHHQKEWTGNPNIPMKIEIVGSCCTNIAELFLESNITIDKQLAELLYCTIVNDTIDMSVAAGIATEKDKHIISRLKKLLPDVNQPILYKEILHAKSDVSGLSVIDILRKDLKLLSTKKINVAFSSIPILLKEFFAMTDSLKEIKSFCLINRCILVIIMSLVVDENNKVLREIAIFSENYKILNQAKVILLNTEEIDLRLTKLDLTENFDNLALRFLQEDIKSSRKVVLPYFHRKLHLLETVL